MARLVRGSSLGTCLVSTDLLDVLRSRDGTPFSLRVIKPKSIRIKATDLNGKAYDFEIPWK